MKELLKLEENDCRYPLEKWNGKTPQLVGNEGSQFIFPIEKQKMEKKITEK